MAAIPVVLDFHGDFALMLVTIEDHQTMDEAAAACAYHVIERRVPAQPGKILRVRKSGASAPFPRDLRVAESGLGPMDDIEVYYE